MDSKKILLGHGNGGRMTHQLLNDLFLKKLSNPVLKELSDSALLKGYQEPLAFTIDSFVVAPLFFSGGDIGRLAVCGTINDLVMQGAMPEHLALALIIEEGLEYKVLEGVVNSIARTGKAAGVPIVTGDTKVVEKKAADKLFITTSGIGRITKGIRLSVKNISPGDKVIITGDIARHGLAVLSGRKDLHLGFSIKSDCNFLHKLIIPILKKAPGIKFMRDPTRGGLATTLNEVAQGCGLGVILEEKNIPLIQPVRVACELLGIDPLYIACEGRAILVVQAQSQEKVLRLLRRHALGCGAQSIGTISKDFPGKLILRTSLGTQRIADMLTSEPLPRIC